MRDFSSSSPAVVVGIDGSRSAVAAPAALWALDEVSSDIPLRLVCAVDPDNPSATGPRDAARDLATPEGALQYACSAVKSTDNPVKIEVEIVRFAARNRLFCIDLRSTERIVSTRFDRPDGEGFAW